MPTSYPRYSRFWTLVLRLVLVALSGMMAGSVLLFYYWAFVDVVAPVRALGGDRAINPQVHRGGALFISRNYCVERPALHFGRIADCTVHRRIVDTVVLNYPVVTGPRDEGCVEGKIYGTELPTLIPNGRYRFEERLTCPINPLTEREVKFTPIEFEIVDEPLSRPARRR